MHPEIFHLGKLVIHSYGLMLALSFLFGIWFSSYRARKNGLDPAVISDIGFWVILAAIVGSRLYFVILHFDDFRNNLGGIFNPFDSDSCGIGGLVMFGGLIGALVAGLIFFNVKSVRRTVIAGVTSGMPAHAAGLQTGDILYAINGTPASNPGRLNKFFASIPEGAEIALELIRNGKIYTIRIAPDPAEQKPPEHHFAAATHQIGTNDRTHDTVFDKLGFSVSHNTEKLPFLPYADAMAPSLGFGIFLTRIGCFLNGCCYGSPTDAWFGVRFPAASPAGYYQTAQHAAGLVPSQLFLSSGGLLIALIVLFAGRKKLFDGFQFYLSIALYAILRFGVDFTRYYSDNEKIANLSHNQVVCIVIFIIFTGLIVKNYIFRPETSGDTFHTVPEQSENEPR